VGLNWQWEGEGEESNRVRGPAARKNEFPAKENQKFEFQLRREIGLIS
jgi:hypothetical protein